jgi:2-polyprenyl-6-hydroxyphenyl methylase / 3-demethylubiquinone-9 3-methyltransferase
MRCAMRSGGRLYLHTPNLGYILERMKAANIILRQSPEHVAVRDLEGNLRLLREAGFIIRTAQVVRHYNVLRYLDGLRHLPAIGRWFEARLFIEAEAP